MVSLGLCAGLRRASMLCLTAAALGCGCISLVSALMDSAPARLAALVLITILAPPFAWPGVPRAQRKSMALCSLILALLMAGCARLLHALGLGRTPLILAQFALLPLLAHSFPTGSHAACITLEIIHGARRLELTALVDSGNLLRDPITRLPVIVISRKAAAQLLPDVRELAPGMRLISVRTVAGSTLMPVFRPGEVRLLLPQGWQTVRAVIGLSPDGYSGFQALVPASVITTPQGGLSICP